MNKSHYTIGKNTTWPWSAARVFLRANDKRIKGICRQEINRSPFYGTNPQFLNSFENRKNKIHCRCNYSRVFSRDTKVYTILSTEVCDALLCVLFGFVLNNIIYYYWINTTTTPYPPWYYNYHPTHDDTLPLYPPRYPPPLSITTPYPPLHPPPYPLRHPNHHGTLPPSHRDTTSTTKPYLPQHPTQHDTLPTTTLFPPTHNDTPTPVRYHHHHQHIATTTITTTTTTIILLPPLVHYQNHIYSETVWHKVLG